MISLHDNGRETDGHSSLASLSTAILNAELARRQESAAKPACGSGQVRENYNTPLHVAALIIILVLSTIACSFPIIVRRFPRLPVPHHFLFLSRHFGTGVLIATAFVHLLPTAFVSLTDPCLPSFWNQGYPAMAGFIAMVSVLVVVGIEMFFATRGAGHIHDSEYGRPQEQEIGVISKAKSRQDSRQGVNGYVQSEEYRTPSRRRSERGMRPYQDIALESLAGSTDSLAGGPSPYSESKDDIQHEDRHEHDSDLDPDEFEPFTDTSGISHGSTSKCLQSQHTNGHIDMRSTNSPDQDPLLLNKLHAGAAHIDEHDQQKALLQCLLLEAGILFHSVFIGMALSVATGTPFIVLLIAISFHQTFEGLALGSRIAAVKLFSASSPKPWLMALAYGTTTPVGQAIGLLVHNLYDPASQTGLLMVGIMNAISSGLLLFAGLVELLAEDFLSDKSYVSLRGRRRIQACGSVFAGSMLMALVGAWA